MNDADKLVIKIENGNPINYPLTYSNFLMLFPNCPVEETPTNEVISQYGYEVFVNTPYPQFQPGEYAKNSDGNWTNTWIETSK